jgi:hypothetical protein
MSGDSNGTGRRDTSEPKRILVPYLSVAVAFSQERIYNHRPKQTKGSHRQDRFPFIHLHIILPKLVS